MDANACSDDVKLDSQMKHTLTIVDPILAGVQSGVQWGCKSTPKKSAITSFVENDFEKNDQCDDRVSNRRFEECRGHNTPVGYPP